MSYEGYERGLCKNGHLDSADCYTGLPDECPVCRQPFVWREGVDQTNGEGVETKLRVKTKTARMVKVFDYTYHIPKDTPMPTNPEEKMKDIVELLPCPWCGKNEQVKHEDEYNVFVRCQYCGAMGPEAGDYTSAKEEWNRRKEQINERTVNL